MLNTENTKVVSDEVEYKFYNNLKEQYENDVDFRMLVDMWNSLDSAPHFVGEINSK